MLNKDIGKALALYFTVVVELIAPVLGGFIIGDYADKYFDTHPFLTLTFSVIGIGVSFINLFKILKKVG